MSSAWKPSGVAANPQPAKPPLSGASQLSCHVPEAVTPGLLIIDQAAEAQGGLVTGLAQVPIRRSGGQVLPATAARCMSVGGHCSWPLMPGVFGHFSPDVCPGLCRGHMVTAWVGLPCKDRC